MARKEVAVLDCDRCGGRKKRATQTRKFSVDRDQFVIDLCDEHASAFDRDMGGWSRLARDVTPAVYEGHSAFSKERAAERVVSLPQPKTRFAQPPPDPKIVVVQKLPAAYHLWSLTDHARQRCQDREISERDALLTASDPGYAHPARSGAGGLWVYIRGELAAIVNPGTKTVITVMTRGQLEEREAKEAASAR